MFLPTPSVDVYTWADLEPVLVRGVVLAISARVNFGGIHPWYDFYRG
jgi:hypothetical protein